MIRQSVRLFSTDHPNKIYDVIISGGGMVGTTMALALAKNPAFRDRKIALIEGSPQKPSSTRTESAPFSNRVSAVNPSSRRLFENLGVWKRIQRYQEVNDMKVWGSYSDDTINYKDETGMIKTIAYIIENDEIVDAVSNELRQLDNVDVLYGAKVSRLDLNTTETTGQVTLNNGDIFSFGLVIGADGANSAVRNSMEVQYLTYNYNQRGVVATLEIHEELNDTAWQRFLPSGPIALLPLNNRFSSLVWSTTHAHAQSLLSLSPEEFVAAVNHAFSSNSIDDSSVRFLKNLLNPLVKSSKTLRCCPQVQAVVESSRQSFPLGFGHAVEYVKPRVALIGDAAHKVHPLAGQGVNLGFRDVQNLTTALHDGIFCGRDVGDSLSLQTYQQASQRANVPIMLAIDMIYRVYTSNLSVVRALGSVGIQLTENLPPIKTLMRQVASS